MSEMATHVALGNAARGMSLVSLHNGGGVGIGKAVNGGYGMVLDGSERVDNILKKAMLFDVVGGASRRAWAQNSHALETAEEYNAIENNSTITIPYKSDYRKIEELVQKHYQKGGK
jgi:urocanate hydratase